MPSWFEIVEALPIILALIALEGLLSVDNALAIAAMASHLPGKQKLWALRLGIIGAYAFRGLVIFLAAWIIDNEWVKWLGAAYLVYLMANHLTNPAHAEETAHTPEPARPQGPGHGEGTARAEGQASAAAPTDGHDLEVTPAPLPAAPAGAAAAEGGVPAVAKAGLIGTVVQIELMDLALSVDNVIVAIAMSPKLWVVITGVFIGILALRLVAGFALKLIERFPVLKPTAFILVGFVGVLLMVQLGFHFHLSPFVKFGLICALIGLCLAYAEIPRVRAVLTPVVRFFHAVLRPIDLVISVPFGWLWNGVAGLFRKAPARG